MAPLESLGPEHSRQYAFFWMGSIVCVAGDLYAVDAIRVCKKSSDRTRIRRPLWPASADEIL